jgi:hypothetical protein
MFIRGQALSESFFGKFNHDSADRGAVHIQLFGEIRRRVGFMKSFKHQSPGLPPADKTHQIIHLIKNGEIIVMNLRRNDVVLMWQILSSPPTNTPSVPGENNRSVQNNSRSGHPRL